MLRDCHVGSGAEAGGVILLDGVQGRCSVGVGDGHVAVGEAVFIEVQGAGGVVGG